jgi:hypothetical protein
MNARDRADAHARLILDVNARFCNHEGHFPSLPSVRKASTCATALVTTDAAG